MAFLRDHGGLRLPGFLGLGCEGLQAGVKDRRRAQHAGVEVLKQAPEFAQVVLHGRAGEGQAVIGL